MKQNRFWTVASLGFVFSFFPYVASAALVNCGIGSTPSAATSCQACNLVQLIQDVINYAIGLSIPIAIALIAYAGWLYFTSAASGGGESINRAKSILTTALVGFGVALGAYLMVDTVLHTILKDTYYKSWNKVDCVPSDQRPINDSISDVLGQAVGNTAVSTNPNAPTNVPPSCDAGYTYVAEVDGCMNEAGDIETPNTTTATGSICSGVCVGLSIPNQSSTCVKASDGNCLVTQETNNALVSMDQSLGGGLTATAAIGGDHWATCQNTGFSNSGTCIDAVPSCNMTSASCISSVVNAGASNGIRAVFETNNIDTYNSLKTSDPTLVSNKSVIYIAGSHITGNHFSLYLSSANPAPGSK